ncbi:DNA-binding response regulator [Paenibacillus psychroresistens]|uniref:DNA-binding response regulator n=1 Tax=Paenibacillus psychroresistens TaxID=1778678 RepID=A0A6B8RUB0_9BACL|nr:response regulator transcription factor [Paenibacillus psychroresistens]QGQ98876.1 DNA-binding response regulator [Paenibacillus psychroresistens]
MKIMIVEDEPTIRDMVGEALGKWGIEAVLTIDFEQVLQLFLTEKPHLVLMDINLPAYDGFYWCNKIREVSKVPIIFLSSRNTPMDMVMSMNMGGDDFIQKPFYTDVLVAKINALLRRTYSYAEIESQALEHDGIFLNLLEGNMFSGEQKVELSKNEFKILLLLMQHKGVIVSREKVMRSLWEDESFVDDNTLTVNMTRLRKKLAELGKESFISTKKGQGYMIL